MKLAYTLDEAAAASGVSRTTINEALAKGSLVATYPTSRPVILAADLQDWLDTLPNEAPKKKAS